MAGPYDILIMGLVLAGTGLMSPLAVAWSRHQTQKYISSLRQAALEARREEEERQITERTRLIYQREAMAKAEAVALVAEANLEILKSKIEKAKEEGAPVQLPQLVSGR